MRAALAILGVAIAAASLQRPLPLSPAQQYTRALMLLRNGEYRKAELQAHQAWTTLPKSVWTWRLRLIEAEALLEEGRSDQSGVLLESDRAAAPIEFEIRRLVLTARQPGQSLSGATALATRARQLASQSARTDLQPEIDLLLGQYEARLSRIAAAEEILQRARRTAVEIGDLFREAAATNSLGMVRSNQLRYDLAVPFFEQARELYSRAGARQWVAAADSNLVMCYSQLGDFEKAMTYSQEALRLARPSILLANTFGEIGAAYYLNHQKEQAIPYFRQACDLARQFGSASAEARWSGNLSQVLSEVGDWEGAETALQQAYRAGPEAKSRIWLDLDEARIAEGRRRLPEARSIYEKTIANASANPSALWVAYAGIARTANGDLDLANRSSEAALQVIERSQSNIPRNDDQMKYLARLIDVYKDYVDALMEQNRVIQALAVSDGSRARVLSQRFAGAPQSPAPRSQSEFQAIARQSGSVWLSYWLAPARSFLWVITPQEIRAYPLAAPASEIANLVEEYRGFLESMRDPMQVTSPAGRRLYELLIAPAASLIPPGTRVMVVPDGPLYQLSFQALPVYGASRPHYWVEDNPVSIALSFAVFRAESTRTRSVRRSLLVGDTLPEPGFPKLEFSASELGNAEKHLAGEVTRYVGAAARPEFWKQVDPGQFDVIHFAAHAEANRRSPLDSAIILSPGNGFRLSARDIVATPLQAELVTLSACRSSGARTYAGEGLVGLTWAFLQAGSRNVVAGLWDVADRSTSRLMDRFYAEIAQGAEPAEALRASQLDLLHSAYAKPYYWAPFQCYRR